MDKIVEEGQGEGLPSPAEARSPDPSGERRAYFEALIARVEQRLDSLAPNQPELKAPSKKRPKKRKPLSTTAMGEKVVETYRNKLVELLELAALIRPIGDGRPRSMPRISRPPTTTW